MQIEDILSNNVFIFFRWVVTVAGMLVYGQIASYNLQQLHIGWKRKRAKDPRPAESMVMGNFLVVAAVACPFSLQSEIAWLFWIIMFFVDPASWFWLLLPFVLVGVIFKMLYSVLVRTLWPIKYLWQHFKQFLS